MTHLQTRAKLYSGSQKGQGGWLRPERPGNRPKLTLTLVQ
jgi:hypothetical protein